MEPNNNKTTVGGVTFGTGASADATPAAPAETMPFPAGNANSSEPVTPPTTDPFAASAAPAEPAAPVTPPVTDPFAASAAPAPAAPAASEAAPEAAPAATVPQAPVVPIADPLAAAVPSLGAQPAVVGQADLQSLVNSVVEDPAAAEEASEAEEAAKKSKKEAEAAVKKFLTIALVSGILAVVFLAVGVVGLVMAMKNADEVATTKAKLDDANTIIHAVEDSAGLAQGSITSADNVPVYKATTGYIYISEWGIKIKIPDNLEKVSYILNQNYRPSICFNAVQKGVQYFPDFANIALNPGRMGCLTRIATSEGSFDAASGLSFGELVFTYKDYNYFYTGPIDYSNPETDAANLGLEHTAHTIIHSMLSDNIEAYE